MSPRPLFIILFVAMSACSGTSTTPTTTRHPTPPPPATTPTLVEQARRLLIGDGVPQDRRRALVLFERACKQGDLPGCVAISNFVDFSDDRGYGQIIEQSLRSQCVEGRILACRYAGRQWSDEDNLAPTLCQQGIGYACRFEAFRQANHFPIDFRKHDNPDAEKLLVKACEMGDVISCKIASLRDKTSPYYKRALELRKIGCRAGYAPDCDATEVSAQVRMSTCVDLLDAYACDISYDDDPEKERRMREFGCALDEGQCHALGEFAEKELHDLELARRAYLTSCRRKYYETGQIPDCLAAARLFEPVDRERAKSLRERAEALRTKKCRASVPDSKVDCSGSK